jgi:hypothetical protein
MMTRDLAIGWKGSASTACEDEIHGCLNAFHGFIRRIRDRRAGRKLLAIIANHDRLPMKGDDHANTEHQSDRTF